MAVKNRIVTDAEFEPPYDDLTQCPKTITKTRRYHDGKLLYVAGSGPHDTDLMFVASAVQEDEASQHSSTTYGMTIKEEAEYLKGSLGVLFRDTAMECGIDLTKCFYTAVVKWLMPTMGQRNKPPARALRWGNSMLMDEVKKVKPKIIVCLGKAALDALSDENISFKDAHGCWLWSEKAQALLYLMYSPHVLLVKPEIREMFRVDLREIKTRLDILNGVEVARLPENFITITNSEELRQWVALRLMDGSNLFSLDCEWHKSTHIDGELRSMQLAWTETDAMYVRFRDEERNYVFDVDYEEVGNILRPLLGREDVKYVGHHYAADSVWLSHWLKLPVLGKCVMDTEFAQQTVDEHSELGLERGIAMKYTTLGRYNQDLTMWKRANKASCVDGYGLIPDSILIPYACRDVIAVMRAVPQIRKQLELQKLDNYYDTIFNPFVTDVFTMFALMGLPMDIEQMDDLRELFNYARGRLEQQFRDNIKTEARTILTRSLIDEAGIDKVGEVMSIVRNATPDNAEEAWKEVKKLVGIKKVTDFKPIFDHCVEADDFNLRSKPMMNRWLFDVCKYTPVKSTNQKAEGRPSMAWDKVMLLPPDRRKLYTPASDKQTLMIIAQNAPLVDELLSLNVVGNLCKAFLKEPELVMNDDGEWEGDEAGIHKWLASNGRIHGMTSTTATGRPRSWKPNVLNWPSYVNDRIAGNVAKVIREDMEAGVLPAALEHKWGAVKKFPSIRSCVSAPEGYVFVESDYQTAEIRGLAIISGDANLTRMILGTNPEYGIHEATGDVVRLKYLPYEESGILAQNQDPTFVMSRNVDDNWIPVTEDELLKGEAGELIHPKYDLHWSLAEMVQEKPREVLNAKLDRGGIGKVGNFSCLSADSLVSVLIDGKEEMVTLGGGEVDGNKVWDGQEWVSHDGVFLQGYTNVISHDGVTGTPAHVVWSEHGIPMPLLDAKTTDTRLLDGADVLDLPAILPDYKGLADRVHEINGMDVDDIGGIYSEKVYDIVNCGPRFRFVADGKLVSNSAYGATETTLERKIESDTGVKPEPGTGKKLLDALKRRQPRAFEYLEECEEIPEKKGFIRANSGRLKHCVIHDRSSGVNFRIRNSISSAQGRECRNFECQESVASTAARAGKWLMDFCIEYGLEARPITILYDSVVTLTPLHERFVVTRLHDLFMYELNTWTYPANPDKDIKERTLSYPIDNELNYRWSTAPSKEETAQLMDTEWNSTPDHLKWLLTAEIAIVNGKPKVVSGGPQ